MNNQPTIRWTGDLNDDCTAIVGDYMLRAEEMDRNNWWWAVVRQSDNEVIDTSNNYDELVKTGEAARGAAERVARIYATQNIG